LYAFVGIDGGFDNNEADYEETHNIVILPDYVSLSYPSVELPEKVSVAHCFWFFVHSLQNLIHREVLCRGYFNLFQLFVGKKFR